MGEVAHLTRREWLREAVPWHRRPEPEPVPFAELVLAHYLRQAEVYANRSYGGPEEKPYQQKLKGFIAANGRIVDAYWCTQAPSAVAVTERMDRSWRHLWSRQGFVAFHAETDWITGAAPLVADQVHACTAL